MWGAIERAKMGEKHGGIDERERERERESEGEREKEREMVRERERERESERVTRRVRHCCGINPAVMNI